MQNIRPTPVWRFIDWSAKAAARAAVWQPGCALWDRKIKIKETAWTRLAVQEKSRTSRWPTKVIVHSRKLGEESNVCLMNLFSHLRATAVAVTIFLDAFQKVADLATNSRGRNSLCNVVNSKCLTTMSLCLSLQLHYVGLQLFTLWCLECLWLIGCIVWLINPSVRCLKLSCWLCVWPLLTFFPLSVAQPPTSSTSGLSAAALFSFWMCESGKVVE